MRKHKICRCCGKPTQMSFYYCENCRIIVKRIIDNDPTLSKKNSQFGELTFKKNVAFFFIVAYLLLSCLLEENIYTTVFCTVGQMYAMLSHLIITIRREYLDIWLYRQTTILAKKELQKEGLETNK